MKRDVADKPHTVYVHLDADGYVIYVGCTVNLRKRTADHRRYSFWGHRIASVEVESVQPNRGRGLVREYRLIRYYQPAYNRYGRDEAPSVPIRWVAAQELATARGGAA